jgi:hypothetical protein
MDELLWLEAARVVSHGETGPVDIKRRLIQEEILAALGPDESVGPRVRHTVRARLLTRLHETGVRIERQQEEIVSFFIEAQAYLREKFWFAELAGQPAPDVLPHPEHMEIRDGRVLFIGPTDRAGRKAWATIKCDIRVAACHHDIVRAEFRRTGSARALGELRRAEKYRRELMRVVPAGWNWREEIYCRDSQLAIAKALVTRMREIGYEPTNACD